MGRLFQKVKGMKSEGIKKLSLKALFFILLALLAYFVVAKFISYGLNRYECHSKWVESNIEYKYTLRGGCLLKLGKGWIPEKNYRIE